MSSLVCHLLLQWVQDGSPSHSTPVKVDSPNQFVPLGTNKKEFKKLQQAVSMKFFVSRIYLVRPATIYWNQRWLPLKIELIVSTSQRTRLANFG